MLIIVVKDVGKLPYSRATTQTQWHSSQPNSIPVNRTKHTSDEKPVSSSIYTETSHHTTCVINTFRVLSVILENR